MIKYRIVQLAPIHHRNAFEIQIYKNNEWDSLLGRYNSLYEAQEYVIERQYKDSVEVKTKLELEAWNATHGKYQVLREYE